MLDSDRDGRHKDYKVSLALSSLSTYPVVGSIITTTSPSVRKNRALD